MLLPSEPNQKVNEVSFLQKNIIVEDSCEELQERNREKFLSDSHCIKIDKFLANKVKDKYVGRMSASKAQNIPKIFL